MTSCATCHHADDGGIIGTQTTCTLDQRVTHGNDACDRWDEDTRPFAERYPDYPHLHGEAPDAMARVIRERVANGEQRVEIQPGLVVAMPRGEVA